MIPEFSFEFPTVIEFGNGVSKNIMNAVNKEGAKKVLIVTDPNLREIGMTKAIEEILAENGIEFVVYSDIQQNPLFSQVDAAGNLARDEGCEMVIAIGGGGPMDAGKGAGVIATNGGSIQDYMYMRGDDMKIPENKFLPTVCIPTTSGTGSEVSDCIVITDSNANKDLMLTVDIAPDYAFVDPELTFGVPRHITQNTGLDVLGHAIEAIVANLESQIADLFGYEAIRMVFKYLPAAVEGDKTAREYMSLASMYAGIAESKNGCVIPHAVSCPLSVHHKVAHGLGVGLAQVANIEFIKDEVPEKFEVIMDHLGVEYEHGKAADKLIEMIHQLFHDIGVDERVDIGPVTEEMIKSFAVDASRQIDIEGSPRQPVELSDLEEVFRKILVM